MPEPSSALVMITLALAKHVAGEDRSISALSNEALSTTFENAGAISKWLHERVAHLDLGRAQLKSLLHEPTVIDLLGVAWAEELGCQDVQVLQLAFGSAHDRLNRQLSPQWFVSMLLDHSQCDLLSTQSMTETHLNAIVADMAAFLTPEAIAQVAGSRFDGNADAARQLTADILRKIPTRTEELFLAIPANYRTHTLDLLRRNLAATESTLRILSGETAEVEAAKGLHTYLTHLSKEDHTDAFSRTDFDEGSLPELPLRDIYVEPELANGEARIGLLETMLSHSAPALLVVRGDFGTGKSITCRRLAAELARARLRSHVEPIPLLVAAPDVLLGTTSTLESAVRKQVERQCGTSDPATTLLLKGNRFILILDAFDEVGLAANQDEEWVREVSRYAQSTGHATLMTTRPLAVPDRWLSPPDRAVDILPFSEAQTQTWIARASPFLALDPATITLDGLSPEILATPILLLMAAWSGILSERGSGTYGDTTTVYRSFIEKICIGKWPDVQSPHPVVNSVIGLLSEQLGTDGEREYRRALGILAWLGFARSAERANVTLGHYKEVVNTGISRREIDDALQAAMPYLNEAHREQVVRAVVLSVFLRKSSENPHGIVFTHKSFQEYLAAERLFADIASDPSRLDEIVLRNLADFPLHSEICVFFAGLQRLDSKVSEQALLKTLDSLADYDKGLVFHDDSVRPRSWEGATVYEYPPLKNRTWLLRRNGEFLAAHIRGHSRITEILSVLATQSPFLLDGTEYRAIIPSRRQHLTAIAEDASIMAVDEFYNRLTGGAAFVQTAAAFRNYRNFCERFPDYSVKYNQISGREGRVLHAVNLDEEGLVVCLHDLIGVAASMRRLRAIFEALVSLQDREGWSMPLKTAFLLTEDSFRVLRVFPGNERPFLVLWVDALLLEARRGPPVSAKLPPEPGRLTRPTEISTEIAQGARPENQNAIPIGPEGKDGQEDVGPVSHECERAGQGERDLPGDALAMAA